MNGYKACFIVVTYLLLSVHFIISHPIHPQDFCYVVLPPTWQGLACGHPLLNVVCQPLDSFTLQGDVGDPGIGNMSKLEQVLKGIKSAQTKGGDPIQPRLPITPALLLAMKGVWEHESVSQDKAILWAAASLCFFGFLRSREVCIPGEKAFVKGAHLTMQDIHVDNLANPQSVQVRIKASKTDPFHQGVLVYVGHTNQPLCPVSALLVYMVRRATGQVPCSSSRMAGLSRGHVSSSRSGRLCWQLGLTQSPIQGIFSVLGLPPLLFGKGWRTPQ